MKARPCGLELKHRAEIEMRVWDFEARGGGGPQIQIPGGRGGKPLSTFTGTLPLIGLYSPRKNGVFPLLLGRLDQDSNGPMSGP